MERFPKHLVFGLLAAQCKLFGAEPVSLSARICDVLEYEIGFKKDEHTYAAQCGDNGLRVDEWKDSDVETPGTECIDGPGLDGHPDRCSENGITVDMTRAENKTRLGAWFKRALDAVAEDRHIK